MNKSELIRKLRDITSAGMKDCVDALNESQFDLEKAVDLIKIKGLNISSARSSRSASEGVLDIQPLTTSGFAMVEVNSQTDFVAKMPAFLDLARAATLELVQSHASNREYSPDSSELLSKLKNNLISSTKENIVIRRFWVEEALLPSVKVYSYMHPNNQIAVLLTMQCSNFTDEVDNLANDLAMQIAAMAPISVSPETISASELKRQEAIFLAQVDELKKPQAAIPRIMEGKFNKWYTEVCLLKQESVVVPKKSVASVIDDVAKATGSEIKVVNFIRAKVGEGVEVKENNFANEVNQLAGIEEK
jgi:elongation factor Ts